MIYRDEAIDCADPECAGSAEPEQDGSHGYYECTECGFSFGYSIIGEDEGSCAIGIPEATRRALAGTPVTLGTKP